MYGLKPKIKIVALVVVGFFIIGLFVFVDINTANEVDIYEDTNHEAEIEKDLGTDSTFNDEIINTNQNTMKATLKTNKGDIALEFYPELAPKAVENFLTLAGQDYYDGVIFHRVIEEFMIQGGDPTGTGTGGPGYTFEDEFKPEHPEAKKGYARGTVAMANSGPNTNGSQFFIVHKDAPLPYSYTIFGRVTEGMEVVDEIASVETDPQDKPLDDVVIESVLVSDE